MKLGGVQALRALAALLVVGDHLPRLEAKLFPGGLMHGFGAAGAMGVDLFFVISGFIMISTTWDSFGAPGAASGFIVRRFVRIYPAYWAALFTFIAIGRLFPGGLNLAPINAASLITSTLLIPYPSDSIMVVAWSLAYEVYFYIVFALALRFAKSRLPMILGLWCASTLALNLVASVNGNAVVQFLGSPLALEFMAGTVVGYLLIHRRIVAPRLALVVGGLGALAVAVYAAQFDGLGSFGLAWFRVLAAGPAMVLIVYGTVSLEERGQLHAPRFAVALGDASYAMYLWHGLLLGAYAAIFFRLHLHGRLADAVFILGGLSVAAFGSLAVARLVEAPVTRAAKGLLRMDRNAHRVAVSTP